MYTGIRLSNLALGEPLLNQNYEYNGKTGKDAIIERLHDQFFKIYNLGIEYVIDTITIQNNNSILSLYQGIGGNIWTLDERLQLYQQYAEQYNINIVIEIDISNVTASNVNQYCNTILYDIILQYSWVRHWIIGIQPDLIVNNQYKCAPELYTYILQQIYPKIKMLNSNILIGGPNIHQSLKQYIIDKTGWLSIACGDLYNQDYTYNNLGKNGILDYIDIFAIIGKQDSQYCPYNEYANIVYNIRELLYSKLSTNNILIFATNQGHTVALNDTDIYNSIINSITDNVNIENMTNAQLNQYTQNLFNTVKTTELNRQAYNDTKEICNAIKVGVISFKRELLDSTTSKYGIYTSPSSVSIAKSSTYPFLFDILKNYTTVVRDSSIYESNNNIESITLQQETDNIINRATIIWPVSEQPVNIILQATSNIRQYYINNATKKNVDYTYTTELTIAYNQLLVVYEQVNQFVFDETDIKLNISRRLQYQRDIHDHMMKILPSSFNKDTTDTNVYRIMRAFATELADASMRVTMLKEDLSIDTAREDALYHNFGSLIRLQKQSTWSYEKYRKLIKGILSSLFRGPTVNSVATALQLFTEFKVSINELYKEKVQKKYADLLKQYNPDFTFIIEVEKPLDNNTYTQKELIEENAYILQLTKPAHTIGLIIIILVGNENWYTFYKDKYNTDWNTSDETDFHADFNKNINENTYGWKAIDYPGIFTISPTDNGIYQNSLLNGSAIIGPQYTLLDTAHLNNSTSLTDLYNNNQIKEQLIYSIGSDAIEEYHKYTSQLCAISAELNEPRFGFITNKYMQLSGDNIIDKVLNKYALFGHQSKLKDELLVYQQQFFSDKFLFSSAANAIKFTTPDGISKQFTALNNIITEWQNYLKEHSFKEKLIDGQIIERISDNINLYLEGYKEKFKNIYEQNKLAVDLNDNANIADDITPPIKLNEQYNGHTFIKRKREKIFFNPLYNELYNIPDEIYPYTVYWNQMTSDYFNPVQDYHSHNNIDSYISEEFYLKYHQNKIRFNRPGNYLYTRVEKFDMSYIHNDKYIFIPDDTLGLDIIKSYKDNYAFTITDERTALHSELTDKFGLKYQQDYVYFNNSNGKLINYNIEKYNLHYYLQDKYLFDKNDDISLINISNKHSDNYEFTITDERIALHNELTDQFGLKYNQQYLHFNNSNGKLISYHIEKYNLYTYLYDKYIFNKDEVSLTNISNKHSDNYEFTITDEKTALHNELADKFELKYNQQYLRFNNSNGKLISYHVEKYKLNYWYKDKYIFNKDEVSLININNKYNDNYNFTIKEEIPILHSELTDQFGLKYNQQYLQFNKSNKKFISNNIEKFNLHYYFNDLYDKSYIHGQLIYHIDFLPRESYNFPIKEEIPILYTELMDQYQLKYQQNHLQLNRNNNKFINNFIEKYDLYTYYIDQYNFSIIDNFDINLDFINNDKYRPIQDKLYNVYNDSNNKERYQLKYQQNYLQLNKNNNKFINNFAEKYNLYTYYIDKYNFSIIDNFNINLDFINKDKYIIKNELYNVYNNFSDKYQLKYQQNHLRLNKSNNKFISYLIDKYDFNTYTIDHYNFSINENFNVILNFINKDKYIVKHELYNVYNNFSDKYQLKYQQNHLKLNKNNNKFISYLIEKYDFYTYATDYYNFSINDNFNTNIKFINKEQAYNIKHEFYDVHNNLVHNDQYQLKYNQNHLRLNKNNNKFISYLIEKYDFYTYAADHYNFFINDNFNTDIHKSNEEETYNVKHELYGIYNNFEDQYQLKYNQNHLRLNTNNNKFINNLIEKYDLYTYYIDKYNFSIIDNFNTNIRKSNEEEIYNVKHELYNVYNNFSDQYQLKYNQNHLRLNKSNNKFINYLIEKYNLYTYYIDKYNFSIIDNFNTDIHKSNEEETYNVKHELYGIYNNFEDHYYIFDEDNNNYLGFITKSYDIDINNNIYTNEADTNNLKLILKKLYGIFKFNRMSSNLIYKDKYNRLIEDSIIYNINHSNQELYKAKNELYMVYNDFYDQYSIYDEDNALILNKHNGIFISKYATKYYLSLIYNEKYNFNINDNVIYNINYSNQELYKAKDTKYEWNSDLIDRYSIYDEDNALILNKHNGVFISKYAIKYYFNPIYKEKYNFNNIKNEYTYHYNNFEDELYKAKNTKYEWNSDLIDRYSIYDEDNALILNKHNGIFISKYATKYYFNPIYNEKYNFNNIKNEYIYHYNNFEDELYKAKDTKYEWNPDLIDQYSIYDEDNALILNKHNGVFISKYATKYHFNPIYNEKYSGLKNDIPTFITDALSEDQYLAKNDNIAIMHPDYSEHYILNENMYQFNKFNGKLMSIPVVKYMFNYRYKENDILQVKEKNINYIRYPFKDQIIKDIVDESSANITSIYNQIYDKAYDKFLIHYYKYNYNKFNSVQENNFNNIHSFYTEKAKNITENLFTNINNTYYQIYDKAQEWNLMHYYKNDNDKFNLIQENNFNYIKGFYNEKAKDIIENLFTDINSKYYQIYDKAQEWDLVHYYNNSKDKFNSVQIINFNHLRSFYNEHINDIIDNSFIHYKYSYNQIYHQIQEFSIPNFISFDKYKQVDDTHYIYDNSTYNEKIDPAEDKIDLIQSDNKDKYFNLNIDIKDPLQFNKMRLNKCKFITTSNETYNIDLMPKGEDFITPQELDIVNISNSEIIERPEEIAEANEDLETEYMYNNDIRPFQFNISQFNQNKFTYNNIIEDSTINIINTEYMIKPLLVLNHINIQYKEYMKKIKSKMTANIDTVYNETYKNYMVSYMSEIIKNEYEKKYEIESSVAYMQAEKRINNQYIIVKKNSYV